MPRGPNGEKRPADAIGAAVMVARVATGEIDDAKSSGRRASGLAGAKARSEKISPEKRSQTETLPKSRNNMNNSQLKELLQNVLIKESFPGNPVVNVTDEEIEVLFQNGWHEAASALLSILFENEVITLEQTARTQYIAESVSVTWLADSTLYIFKRPITE